MLFAVASVLPAQNSTSLLNYGDFESWIVRHVKESSVLGGDVKTLYEIGPAAVWDNNDAYTNQGGSPWATSNVLARVAGITKTNTSVYRDWRGNGNGYCAKLVTHTEGCKVLGVVNIYVLAAGSIYFGATQEPITSSNNPMSKLNAGIPFTRKPVALQFDYKVQLSGASDRIRRTGFSPVKTVSGKDMPDVVLFLQKRWEDSDGNIHAKRVGTLVHRFDKSTDWVKNARFTIHYGDIRNESFYRRYMDLRTGENTKYALNSQGKMVKVVEEGWGSADDTPTHMILQFDSSFGGAYVGAEGTTFWIDNVKMVY